MSRDLILSGTVFVVAVTVAVALSLAVLTMVLRLRHRHRKRLARVGRKRLSGRLDLDDARLMLLRQKQEANVVVRLTDALAKVFPLVDTARLRANFTRAGLGWSVATFVFISLGVSAVLAVGSALLTGRSILLLVVPSLLGGMSLVDRLVKFLGGRRSSRFMKQLPDAIDTIIRGIRSGLPVIECIGSVGQEYDDPVGGHFRAISERVMLGEPLESALWRVARVIDRPEMDFFAISIAIQSETGGSLSDALGNLADLLRARERADHRRPAVPDARAADDDEPGLRDAALHRSAGPDDARRRAGEHRDRRLRDVADDAVRDLKEAAAMSMSPLAVLGLSAALASGLLLLGASHWLYERRTRMRRVRSATGRRQGRATAPDLRPAKATQFHQGALAFMRAATGRLAIVKGSALLATKRLLTSAGHRGRDAIVVYTFFKLVMPLVFLAGAALYVYGLDPIGKGAMFDAAAVVAAALLGSKLPDLYLKNKQQKRLDSIRKALPDALDMLVICAEAGLSSDAALKRVVAETSRKSSILGEELNQTALELSFMPERRVALENLAERAPLPSINAFVSTMIQAERYGTPLARAFKVLSQEQRTERMLRAEEKAGRLPATMTVPMMLFILPALFIVLIGPAVLDILDNFINM